MFQQNIILTGFMGTGKSAIGRLLAEETGRVFIDTDETIVNQTGRTVGRIFEESGESAFRSLERSLVFELVDREGLVVATGGGLVVDPLNVVRLSRNGLIICLTASPEEIVTRLARQAGERPLLVGPDPESRIRRLLAERDIAYRQFPQIDTSGKSPGQIVAEVRQLVERLQSQEATAEPPTSRLSVRFPGGQYDILIGRKLLPNLADVIPFTGPAAVLTDENVGPLYAHQLARLDPMATITIPAGEKHKNLKTVSFIYDQLIQVGLDRKGTLICLGGGVVGDIGGFVAATYLRGIKVVQVPTTLLAMVDASIGGKSGVDLPQGKNLVGAFKQPEAVLADLDTLATLPAAELANGMAEVVKHALIGNTSVLLSLAHGIPSLHEITGRFDWQALLVEAIQVKQAIVEQDPYEHGRRAVLNLGHTFAHAIEQVSGYSVAHGSAVAIGLVGATRLSAQLGHCSPRLITRVEATLDACSLPTRLPADLSVEKLVQAMGQDKKRTAGQLRFILIRRPGDVFLSGDVPLAAVSQTWQALRS